MKVLAERQSSCCGELVYIGENNKRMCLECGLPCIARPVKEKK